MKRLSKIAIIMLIFTVLILSATACSAPEEILIEEGNMPTRLSFVEGQDLDLSGGKLTVKFKSKTEEISLTSSDVKITGYDKNKLGEQQLTISYKDKSTTLVVTVVPRVSVENFEQNYLRGDSFDRSKGRIKIMADNGSFQPVLLSNPAMTIEGFDSADVGAVIVTARYQSSSATFTVNVHEIEYSSFVRPSKTNYKSHEDGIDLKGSHITLTGNGGKTERHIPITSYTISGFDLSAATIDNMTTPLEQIVTVGYLDLSFNFTVKITYSAVSYIKKIANELSTLDWTGEQAPTLTEAEGDKAIEAAKYYFNLTEYDKGLITMAEKEQIMRPAAVAGFALWQEEAISFNQTFTIGTQNNPDAISLLADNYNKTKEDLNRLKDSTIDFNVMVALLTNISDQFFSDILVGEIEFGDYLDFVPAPQSIEETVLLLEFITSLYEELKDLPTDWTVIGLENYETEITQSNTLIEESIYLKERALFGIIASWRSDFFDIIYSYYYYYSEDGEAAVNGLLLKNTYLPGLLEDMYVNVTDSIYQIAVMTLDQEFDATRFMWHYRNALNFKENIINSENELYIALYDCLTFSGLLTIDNKPVSVAFEALLAYLKTAEYGYLHLNGRLLSDKEFDSFWEAYLIIVDKLFDEDEDFNQALENLMQTFVNLSPAKQYGVLASLNTYYIKYNTPQYSLDFSQYTYTVFANMIANHYREVLPPDAFAVYQKLLLALESYAKYQMGHKEDNEDFLTFMGEALNLYDALEASDKETFDGKLAFFFEKYQEIYHRYDDPQNPYKTNLLEWQEIFDELANTLRNVDRAYKIVTDKDNPNYNYNGALIASYLYAERLAQGIINNAPKNIVEAYYYEGYRLFDKDMTLEYALYHARSYYIDFLTETKLDIYGETTLLFDIFSKELESFIADAAYVIWTYFDYVESQINFVDVQRVIDIMASFRALDPFNQILFTALIDIHDAEEDYGMYYKGIKAFFEEGLSGEALGAANELLAVEAAYMSYINRPNNATLLEEFKTAMATLMNSYGELGEADLADFNEYLSEMYQFYLAKYEELNTPRE